MIETILQAVHADVVMSLGWGLIADLLTVIAVAVSQISTSKLLHRRGVGDAVLRRIEGLFDAVKEEAKNTNSGNRNLL